MVFETELEIEVRFLGLLITKAKAFNILKNEVFIYLKTIGSI
jgi:hypothetical protein